MPVQGTGERTLAVFVAETKPAGSMLRKFLFVPQGHSRALAAWFHACCQCIVAFGCVCMDCMSGSGQRLRHNLMRMRQMLLDKQVCVLKKLPDTVSSNPAGNYVACCRQ